MRNVMGISSGRAISQAGTATRSHPVILPSVSMAARGWGLAPTLSVVIALGLLMIALSFNGSRFQTSWAEPLYWAGLLLMFVPAAVRMAGEKTSRHERIGIMVALGLGLYVVKVMYSPVKFTFFDELQHWRTAHDIVKSGWLFAENPILTVSPVFPGLEIITQALVSLGGLSIFDAGIILIGISRLVLVLSLYLVFERISASPRVAGIATLLYMANPHFLLFDAQYGYETLALALAALTLYLASCYEYATGKSRLGLILLIVLGLWAVVATHHVTSYLLTLLLFLWSIVAVVRGGPASLKRFVPAGLALLSITYTIAWFFLIANKVMDYLGPQLYVAYQQLVELIANERPARLLFQDVSGEASLWTRITGFASVGFILIGMPFGLLEIRRKGKYRKHALVVALALASLAYPVTLALRFTPWGLTVGSRMAPYLFVGVALVLGIGINEFLESARARTAARLVFVGWAVVIFVGTVASALAAWGMPGPYVAQSYTRSVDLQSIVTVDWTRDVLGPGQRFASEPSMLWIMGSYGEQRPVTPDADKVWVQNIFDSQSFVDLDRQLLRDGDVSYVTVDGRASPLILNRGQPAALGTNNTLSPTLQTKFDTLTGVNRLSDSGDIVTYGVEVISHAK